MKHFSLIVLVSFVCFLFPQTVFATISLSISGVEKKDDYYIVDVTATGLSSTSGCFVQGMFTSTPSSFFGYTWSSKGEWLKYASSPSQEFVKENYVELKNDEPQNILVKPDIDVSGYKGPGSYLFKIRRFIANGNSSDYYSNIIQLTLTEPTPTLVVTEEPTPTSTPSPTPTATNAPTPTKTPTSTPTKTPTSISTPTKVSATPRITSVKNISANTAILGDSTSSSSISSEILAQEEPTPILENKITEPINYKTPFFVGLVLLSLSGGLLYFRHRKD